ncbi:MAG: tetratricopeptide repeat protein [Bacteroidetes bacterium]|nr:tetratricopeptide repeat protein [Bacteroidota bacterium]
MDDRYPHEDEPFDEQGARNQADRFEASIAAQQPIFMDINAVEEIYAYYRLHAETQKAGRLVQYALEIYPVNPGLHHKQAVLLLEEGKLNDALDAIDTALGLMPAHTEYIAQKARILSHMGRTTQAFQIMEGALNTQEDRAELYYQLGMLHQQEKDFAKAIAAFEQALHEDEGYEFVLSEILFCYELNQQPEQALHFLNQYLDTNPFSAAAWYNLGMYYLRVGLFEKCQTAMDYALALQPDFTSACHGKGTALMELGRYDLAVRMFLEALSYEGRDISMMLSLAECYEMLEQPKRARFYYTKVTELYEGIPDAWYGIASTLEAEEKHFLAITYYKKAIEHYREYYEAWVGLAECEYAVGNLQSAFEALNTAIEIVPDDIELWQDWAEKLHLDGHTDRALSLLLEGITNNPADADLLYQYAAYALQAGRTAEGFTQLENALLLDPSGHTVVFEYFAELRNHAHAQRLIAQYLPR